MLSTLKPIGFHINKKFLIEALEHLKKGKGLYIPKTGTYGIEETDFTEDDIFNQIIKTIENPPTSQKEYFKRSQ